MKKAIAMLLAFLFVCAIAGCAPVSEEEKSEISSVKEEESHIEEEEFVLSLPYSAEDSLSPVKLTGEWNDLITPLLYDSLYRLDDSFVPVPSMAESIKISGEECRVALKKDLKFSDGSAVSAADVVASFRALKNSGVWGGRLDGVISATASGKNQVIFVFREANKNGAALLTFPVLKKGTENKDLPIGSGYYRFSEQVGGNRLLVLNETNPGAKKMPAKQVKLVSVPDAGAVFYALKTGSVDLITATVAELSNNRGSYVACNSRNMVFLGINSKNGILSDPLVRQAMHRAINRSEIILGAFGGLANNAFFPVHPATGDYGTALYDTTGFTFEKAVSLLSDYKRNNDDALIYEGRPVSLKLLVNKESSHMTEAAKMVEGMLENLGLPTEIEAIPLSELQKRVAAKNYDLYLGEVHLPKDGGLNAFLESDSLIAGGMDALLTRTAWKDYLSGGEMGGFLDAFSKEVPFVPLLFLQQVVMTGNDIAWMITPAENNPFYRMDEWELPR